ncbi:MAG: c-type cytochrome [Flavitalea sp.]
MNKFLLVPAAAALIFTATVSFQKGIDKATMERGKQVYEGNCAPCHQEDGGGVQGLHPSLSKVKWVTGDKKSLVNILLKGMEGEITVHGEVYNNLMPAQAHLTDQEISDVLTYVRNSFGNKGTAVSIAEVKAQRKLIQ